jgi:AcrR family transcriptional regulator
MSGRSNIVRPTPAPVDRRARHRESIRTEIVEAAWSLARVKGLAGLTMRDLGAAVGMRAQSLYSYFASKEAIYDEMFRSGYEEFLAWMAPRDDSRTGPEQAAWLAHRFFTFCVDDPVRYQLLFLRTLPDFTPSAEAYALAEAALEELNNQLWQVGIDDPAAADLATALLTGLVSQQIANDPGGDRWERLIDRSVSMLLAEFASPPPPTRARRASR